MVILILAAIGIGTYFYLNRDPTKVKGDAPEKLMRKNGTISGQNKNTTTTYDFNGTWTIQNYIKRDVPIPLMDANDSLIVITGAQNKSRNIFLDMQNNHCVILPNLTYNSVSARKAYMLGDGHIIVSMKNNRVVRDDVLAAARFIQWKILIVNTKDCSHHNITVIKGDDAERVVDILPYHHTFDVVMTNDKGALPKTLVVRYDNNGSLVNNYAGTIPDDNHLKIFQFKPNNASEGYYYIVSNNSTRSTMKKLNDKFEVVQSFEFSHGPYDDDAYSMNHGRFSMCSFDDFSNQNLTCQIIDAETNKTLMTAHLNFTMPAYYVTLINLPEGGIMIFYLNQHEDNTKTVFVQQVSGTGRVEKPLEFGNVPSDFQDIYYFEMKNGSYLIAISTTKSLMTKTIVAKKS